MHGAAVMPTLWNGLANTSVELAGDLLDTGGLGAVTGRAKKCAVPVVDAEDNVWFHVAVPTPVGADSDWYYDSLDLAFTTENQAYLRYVELWQGGGDGPAWQHTFATGASLGVPSTRPLDLGTWSGGVERVYRRFRSLSGALVRLEFTAIPPHGVVPTVNFLAIGIRFSDQPEDIEAPFVSPGLRP